MAIGPDLVTAQCFPLERAWALDSRRMHCLPDLPPTYFVVLDKFLTLIKASLSELISTSWGFCEDWMKNLHNTLGLWWMLSASFLLWLIHAHSSTASVKMSAHGWVLKARLLNEWRIMFNGLKSRKSDIFPSLILDKFCLILFKFFLTVDPMMQHPDLPSGLKDLFLCGCCQHYQWTVLSCSPPLKWPRLHFYLTQLMPIPRNSLHPRVSPPRG